MRKTYYPDNAVTAGPYSPAVDSGDLVFLSGQIPLDSSTGKLVEGDIAVQTRQCFQNIKVILKAAGLTLDHVVKATVYLTDINDFKAMNEVYAEQFSSPYPSRTAIAVAALPLGAQLEIEVIAKK